MQMCGNGSGPVQGTGILVHVQTEVPQLPNALAPLVQAGDDPPRDMTDARCCVEVSQLNMSLGLGLGLGLVNEMKNRNCENFVTQ